MNIGVFGTGMVGAAIATKLVQLGHRVKMGARSATNEKAAAWVAGNGPNASQGTFADAAAFGELLVNCTKGEGTLPALAAAGDANLNGKVLIDVANPLDFSKGFPPSLTVCNTDSLAEQIQRAHPGLKVVKSLNTMNANLMVNPGLLKGEHDVFVSGDDAGAKAQVAALLQSFGWKNIIDTGGLSTARGTEMLLPIWVRLYGAFQTPSFNFHITRS